jgi:hypothetical protein
VKLPRGQPNSGHGYPHSAIFFSELGASRAKVKQFSSRWQLVGRLLREARSAGRCQDHAQQANYQSRFHLWGTRRGTPASAIVLAITARNARAASPSQGPIIAMSPKGELPRPQAQKAVVLKCGQPIAACCTACRGGFPSQVEAAERFLNQHGNAASPRPLKSVLVFNRYVTDFTAVACPAAIPLWDVLAWATI